MRASQASMLFIMITVTLDMVGIGLVIPSLPQVMRPFASGEAQVSELFGYFVALYAVMQFIASPLLGALSDKIGRRPVLLVSILAAGLDYVLMAFAPNLEILFLGRVISGLTGASLTVANAYVADVSHDGNRSSNFGRIGAAFGFGFIIGPAIGGLIGNFGPHAPFLAAAGMNLLNFLFGLFILPESLPAEKRRAMEWKRLNPLATLNALTRIPRVLGLASVYFLLNMAGQTHGSIWTLYTESRYGWTSFEIGLSLTLVGVLSAVTQGWATGKIVPKLGELRTVRWGAWGTIASMLCFAGATQGWMIYAILAASAIFWVSNPALQSLITGNVPPEAQGEFQGALVSLMSLASILNPIITTQLFSHFGMVNKAPYVPGAPYLFAALMAAAALPVLYFGQLGSRKLA